MKHKAKRAASLALGLALALQVGAAASAQGLPTGGYENGAAALNLTQIARYSAGQYNVDGGVMEIVTYNSDKALVEAEDDAFQYGDMTSVAISPDNTTLAAALQAEGHNDPGRVALFTCGEDGSLTLQGLVEAGAQPDMVTFADNATALTADEGEPREGYGENTVDPKGRVRWWTSPPLTMSGTSWRKMAWC